MISRRCYVPESQETSSVNVFFAQWQEQGANMVQKPLKNDPEDHHEQQDQVSRLKSSCGCYAHDALVRLVLDCLIIVPEQQGLRTSAVDFPPKLFKV